MAWHRSVEAGQEGRLVGWPADVRPISSMELSFLGVDPSGGLYWDGRQIQLTDRTSSVPWGTIAAAAGAIGAVLTAAAAVLRVVL